MAGTQCTAMAVTSLLMAHKQQPSEQTVQTMDEILKDGDKLHTSIHRTRDISDTRGYLSITDIVPLEKKINGQVMRIILNASVSLIGQIADDDNGADFWKPLKPAVEEFFETEDYGVLIANDRSYGIFKNSAYYIFDSHPCDDPGVPIHIDGKACLGKTKTVDELISLIRMKTGFASGDFSIDAIEIEDIV